MKDRDQTLAELKELQTFLGSAVRRGTAADLAERSLLARGLSEIHATLTDGLELIEQASQEWRTERIESGEAVDLEIQCCLGSKRKELRVSPVLSLQPGWSLVSV